MTIESCRANRERRNQFLVFGSPAIGEAEIDEVVATLRSGWLGTGQRVHRFEKDLCAQIGCAYAVALNSCTAGLHLALNVLGIGPQDEVITTPLTFSATANTIVHVGATPVFADVDRATMNLDPEHVERAITSRTKAILPVHLAGRPCDLDALRDIAARHGLVVIEDAAHAIGARYRGHAIGSIGDISVFSFYVTKNVVTGEGGMLVTNNPAWADEVRVKALHGLSRDAWNRYTADGCESYDTIYPGYKYNMMDLQAALGIHQLAQLEENQSIRERHWRRYDDAFAGHPHITTPAPIDPRDRHARHLYTILLDIDRSGVTRSDFMRRLKAQNIGTGIHYTPLHLHSYYATTFGFSRGQFPAAEFIGDRTVSLPLSAKLTDDDVEDVIAAVEHALEQ